MVSSLYHVNPNITQLIHPTESKSWPSSTCVEEIKSFNYFWTCLQYNTCLFSSSISFMSVQWCIRYYISLNKHHFMSIVDYCKQLGIVTRGTVLNSCFISALSVTSCFTCQGNIHWYDLWSLLTMTYPLLYYILIYCNTQTHHVLLVL